MKNTVKIWLGPLFHLFFPRCCVVCGAPLVEGEEAICTHCNINMPRTNYHKVKDNLVERMFWGKIPLERATSYFFYRKGSDFRKILHQFKYGGRKELGAIMGRFMAAELATTDFFEVVGSSPTRGVFFFLGSMVKRLRHRPFTAVTRVQIPLESFLAQQCAELKVISRMPMWLNWQSS